MRPIRRVAVLGAGTMGSRIAAHIANAGVPVLLLDMGSAGVGADGPAEQRNRLVLGAIDALRKTKPPAFFAPEAARLIAPGNFVDDMARIADCDWIIEAVAEDMAVKRALLTRVERHRAPDSIATTNTSGLPVAAIVEGMSESLRRHWFGVHFFNPPRYMRLVEIIATPESDPADVAAISHFCDLRLGKAVVRANDQPNFIANRIGTFAMLNAVRLMMEQGLTIEEVDALTGSAIGWPRTGTFRLADMVGLDVLAHVAENFAAQAERIGDERTDIALPEFMREMLKRKWAGDKTGQGFYKKAGRDAEGRELRLALDWRTLEHRASEKPRFPALDLAKNMASPAERIVHLLYGDPARDKAAAFYWSFLTELFTYAANRLAPQPHPIAQTLAEIDTAMRSGFNWELGPFEMFDAAGVRATTERMRTLGQPVSLNVDRLLDANPASEPSAAHEAAWYRESPSGRLFFDPAHGAYRPVQVLAGVISLAAIKRAQGVLRGNSGASVFDLGDGVAAIELHSKMNALGDDIVSLITQTLRPESREAAEFEAFVITTEGANFSVGANLLQLLLAMQDGEWDEVERAIHAFQRMTQAIKFCPRPAVVAPYGMCLGGGAEVALHAAARRPHAEIYMGLVETGVGLIPAGGGSKEMLLRAVDAGLVGTGPASVRGDETAIFEPLKRSFEAIAMAKVSTSAADARALGYLRDADAVTMNRERLLADAKMTARALADAGYTAPQPRTVPAPGESVLATLKQAVWMMRQAEYISDHDAKVANWAAYALCGGNVAPGTLLSEQYLLDIEREAFLSLCGEKKTQERIAFTLKNGKPLRN